MNNGINTRLAVLDALGWPIGIAVVLVVRADFHLDAAHGVAFLILTIWAMRKLGWALDGYREEDWVVNPINPFALVFGLLLRQNGPYSYTTTTLLVWFGSLLALGGVIKLFA